MFMRSAVIEYAVAVGWFDGGLAGERKEAFMDLEAPHAFLRLRKPPKFPMYPRHAVKLRRILSQTQNIEAS